MYAIVLANRKIEKVHNDVEALAEFEAYYANRVRSARSFVPVPVIDLSTFEVIATISQNGRYQTRAEAHGKTGNKLDFDLMGTRYWNQHIAKLRVEA